MTPSPGGRRAAAVAVAAAAIALGLGLLLALAPVAVEGQEAEPVPRVLDARFEAEIGARGADGRDATRVRLVYRIVPVTAPDTVPLKGLAFFGNRPERVESAFGDGAPEPVSLVDPRGNLLRGGLPLPSDAAPGDTLALTIAYELDRAIPEDARSFDLVIPVLYVDWRPAGAPEDMFVASVTIPADYSVVETFPTVPKELTEAEGARRYDFRVQVIPSMVRFRGHVGEPPVLTFARKVDLGVVLVLIVAGAFGLHGLRRETA